MTSYFTCISNVYVHYVELPSFHKLMTILLLFISLSFLLLIQLHKRQNKIIFLYYQLHHLVIQSCAFTHASIYIKRYTLYINRRKGVNKMNALVSARNAKIYNKNNYLDLIKFHLILKRANLVGIMGPLDRKNDFIKYFIHYRYPYRWRCFYKRD